METCPCGSEKSLEKCCLPYIQGEKLPPTAEETMRSRYTAFARQAVDYILDTHHPSTRQEINKEEVEEWSKNSKWNGLEIKRVEQGGVDDDQGIVEFVAHYESEGQEFDHHEVSEFVKEDDRWFFKDGKIVRDTYRREGPKVGRNDPCPCGSGKKYKKCCL